MYAKVISMNLSIYFQVMIYVGNKEYGPNRRVYRYGLYLMVLSVHDDKATKLREILNLDKVVGSVTMQLMSTMQNEALSTI